MPTTFGNTAFQDARDAVVAELDALMANMVSNSIVPKFDAVYDTHLENPALDYNCVSVGIPEITSLNVSIHNRPEFLYKIELRIMTADMNGNVEEERFLDLANSVVNWFYTYGQSMADNFRFKPDRGVEVVSNVQFAETMSIGGTVTFYVFGFEEYTPA